MRSARAFAAVGLVLGWAAVVPVGIAWADCTAAGDFGASAGCAPPGGSSGGGDSWPPTSVDWPPSGDDTSSGDDDGGGVKDKPATPIVLPAGQSAPETSAAPKPIVPVDAPPAG